MDYMRKHGVKIHTRRPFILTGWNFLDFVIACAYTVDILALAAGHTALRYSWPFRPLRLLSQSSKIQIVMICMMDSVPSLANVVLLGSCIFFVFAVMGLQVFMGTMFTCTDNSVYGKDDCIGMFTPTVDNFNSNLFSPMTVQSTLGLGVPMARAWVLPESNFDHLGSSFMTLFKVASLDQWVTIMYQGIDAVGNDEQPKQNTAPVAALYFVIFVFTGALFIFQLFISVIISVYEDTMSSSSLTDDDSQSSDLERLLEFYSPDEIPSEPSNSIRRFCYNITTGGSAFKNIHENYEQAIMVAITVNIAFMLSQTLVMGDTHKLVLFIQDLVFVTIFVLDIIFKLMALGPVSYLSKRWNIFDVVIVTSGLVALLVPDASVVQMLGVLRIFRLVKTSLQFRMLLSTVLSSMTTIAEIVALMGAILLSYAFIGMQTFDGVKYGTVLSAHHNFDDFPNAFYSLTVVVYGEWVVLLKDLEVESPKCTAGKDCGNPAAGVYLLSFIFLTTFVMTNLVVAVIMNSFTWLYSMENTRGNNTVGVNDLRKFKEIWQTFDLQGTGSVAHKHLKTIVEAVGEPIGRKHVSAMWYRALQAEIAALPGSGSGEISFRNLFLVLTTQMMGADALCETLDGEIKTSNQQVTELAAVQAVVSTHGSKPKVHRRGSQVMNLENEPELSLTDKVKHVKNAVRLRDALGNDESGRPVLFVKESLSLKDKVQLMMRETAVEKAETSGDKEGLKKAKQRLIDFKNGVSKPNILDIVKASNAARREEEACRRKSDPFSKAAQQVSKESHLKRTKSLLKGKQGFFMGTSKVPSAPASPSLKPQQFEQLEIQVSNLNTQLEQMKVAKATAETRVVQMYTHTEKALSNMQAEMGRKQEESQTQQLSVEVELAKMRQDKVRTESTLKGLMSVVHRLQQRDHPQQQGLSWDQVSPGVPAGYLETDGQPSDTEANATQRELPGTVAVEAVAARPPGRSGRASVGGSIQSSIDSLIQEAEFPNEPEDFDDFNVEDFDAE